MIPGAWAVPAGVIVTPGIPPASRRTHTTVTTPLAESLYAAAARNHGSLPRKDCPPASAGYGQQLLERRTPTTGFLTRRVRKATRNLERLHPAPSHDAALLVVTFLMAYAATQGRPPGFRWDRVRWYVEHPEKVLTDGFIDYLATTPDRTAATDAFQTWVGYPNGSTAARVHEIVALLAN